MTTRSDDDSLPEITLDFRSELDEFFQKNGLASEDCCIVGSVCLSIRDLREHGDVDICIAPDKRDSIETVMEPFELASNKYEHIGISDETIVYTDRYHDVVDGYKIIRPEIEYSHKLYRQWDKDKADIELLDQYRTRYDDWEDDLVVDNYTPNISHLARRGVRSLRRDGPKKTMGHGIEILRRHGPFSRRSKEEYETKPISIPARAVQSVRQDGPKKTIKRGIRLVQIAEPTGLLQRYSSPRHKVKLATLAQNELVLQYPTPELITAQYEDGEFQRYDLIVYLTALNTLNSDTELYRRFSELTNAPPLEEFRKIANDYSEDQRTDAIPIGYESELLDPLTTALAIDSNQDRIDVTVRKPKQREERYPIQWFSKHDFSDDEIDALRSGFSRLLSDTGALFEIVLWPPVSDYFGEILETLRSEEVVHSATRLTLDEETFGSFVRDIYRTQTDVRWDYIEDKIERISSEPSEIMSVQIEVPNPRIREQNSHEMKEIKERYRARYNPKVAPDDPNTRRVIHATDNYVHNRETRQVIQQYQSQAIDIEWYLKPGSAAHY